MIEFDKTTVVKKLKEGPCVILFKKENGEMRSMYCTLHTDYLPNLYEENQSKKENDNVIRVWDLGISAWRSFRVSSLSSLIRIE